MPSIDPAVTEILNDEDQHLALGTLPHDHVATVTADQAIDTVLTGLYLPGPALYVGHGIGYVSAQGSEPVWLVIAKVEDQTPLPVGPACQPEDTECSQHWAVRDYAGGLVSDTSGEILRSFVTMHPSSGPSPFETP
jgi:hypothetical protein